MRIALQTWGSDGDILPFIALGGALVERGHIVTLAVGSIDDKDYGEICRAAGVDYLKAPERSAIDLSSWVSRFGSTTPNSYRMLRVLHEEALFPAFDRMSEAAEALCARADLTVGHFLAVPLRIAALKRGLLHASVCFWPGLIPDSSRAPEGWPSLGRSLNRLLWRLGFAYIDRAVGAGFRALYRRHGLPEPNDLVDACYSPRLNLLACSAALWPGYDDLGPHRFCGYFHLPSGMDGGSPPTQVEQFIDRGEAPVFLTLGSSAQIDPDRCQALLTEGAERSGLRAIVQITPGRAVPQPASDRLCFIGRASHQLLFRRCAAVLHHGGAGTTHAALRAGRPAVVVGFMDEQLSWGRRLMRSGAGGAVFRYPRVMAAQLGKALRRLVQDASIRARTDELATRLRQETGVAKAVRYIETLATEQSP